MPTVHLESDDGFSIQLADVDTDLEQVADVIAELAAQGPAITATPTGAQVGIGRAVRARTDFADDEIEALHEVVGYSLDQLGGAASHDLVQSAWDAFCLEPVEFTRLTVIGDGERRDFDLLRPEEFHLKGTQHDHDQSSHGGGVGGAVKRAVKRVDQAIFGDYTPSPLTPVNTRNTQRTPREQQWAVRSQLARAGMNVLPTPADRKTRAGKMFGKGNAEIDAALDVMFPNGAITAPIPFRSASRRKGDPVFDRDLVNETLAEQRILRPVDPRVLHATQSNVTREGVRYYLSGAYERTGETFADQQDRGNIHPVVYKNPSGQWMILSGHHRAAAALLQGRPLDAIVIDPTIGAPPARIGDNIPRRSDLVRNRRRQFSVAASSTVEDNMYRDVTPLLAIDDEIDRPATIGEAVAAIQKGTIAIVGTDDDAVETLTRLGANRDRAAWLVAETSGTAATTDAEFKYNPNQPRVPGGQSGGGRWTSTGGSGGTKAKGGKGDDFEEGGSGTADDPIRTRDVDTAARALYEGKYVQLDQERKVSTLVKELAKEVNRAREAGEEAPNINLCNVSVPGTNLFCSESKGIPRVQMPQLSGVPKPGSKADALPKDKHGGVDIGPAFVEHLESKGIKVTADKVDPRYLRATQNELVGAKVAGIAGALESGVVMDSPIFVTRDDYVVDGHHRWAASVAVELGGKDADMNVRVIDSDIITTLAEAYNFAEDWGIPPKAAKPDQFALARLVLTLGQFHLQGRHDQQNHGNRAGVARVPDGDSKLKKAARRIADIVERWLDEAEGPEDPQLLTNVRHGALALRTGEQFHLGNQHDQQTHAGGRGGGKAKAADQADQIIRDNPDRIPLTELGIKPAPRDVAAIAENTRDDDKWDSIETSKVPSDAKFYGTETDVSTKSVKKVVSGDEPLREGYAPRLYEYRDGYVIADGHHRLAMHVLMGTPEFDAHVRKLPRQIRMAGPRNKRKSRNQWLGDVSVRRTTFHLAGSQYDHDQSTHGGGGGGGAKTTKLLTGDEQWVKDLAASGGDEGDAWLDELPGYDRAKAKADASTLAARAQENEPRVTARLEELAGDDGAVDYHEPKPGEGQLFGYKYRFKKENKIAEKIGRRMRDKNMSYEQAVEDQNDALRYTIHFDEDDFGAAAQRAIDGLRSDLGITDPDDPRVFVKNTWPPEKGESYKGVNVVITEPDGFKWELQFHTPESQRVKDQMHILYEAQRVLPKSDPRWRLLEDSMSAIGNGQPTPRDAVKVFRRARMSPDLLQ